MGKTKSCIKCIYYIKEERLCKYYLRYIVENKAKKCAAYRIEHEAIQEKMF